jgi:putative transposase
MYSEGADYFCSCCLERSDRYCCKVLQTIRKEDRTAICVPRYHHQAERPASRAGSVPSEVVLGGRKVAIRRPRVRAGGHEGSLPPFQAFADIDPLDRRVVEQMLVGVATRQYARSLELAGLGITTRGTSKSAVTRRFVAKTAAQLEAWRARPLDGLDLIALLIDGVQIADHCTSWRSASTPWEENTRGGSRCA